MTSQSTSGLKAFLEAYKHHKASRLKQAESICRQILQADPDNAHANNLLGIIALQAGRNEIAVQLISRAIKTNPHEAFFYNSLGNVLKEQGKLDKARKAFNKAIHLNPDYAEAHSNLGGVLKAVGKQQEAIASYRTALSINPQYVEAHSNLVYGLLSLPSSTQKEIYQEAKKWEQQHAKPVYSKQRPHDNSKEEKRRLRIGYISPDFRSHAVNVFFEPVLKVHNRKFFEIYLYANVGHPDKASKRLQSEADHWLSIVGTSDEKVAERIRKDRIDILVDLAKHTNGNRLLVFAYKPAPIQVTWSGHPGTTGMQAIDYRFVDELVCPRGREDEISSEELIRLEHGLFCFEPTADAPGVTDIPVKKAGRVTFGSFNNLHKINTEVIALWSEILNKVPDSHLVLIGKPFVEKSTKKHFLDLFAGHGIEAARIELIPRIPFQEYLVLHGRIDIALDPFPYNGHTTTCDNLWMGVPVITLRCRTNSGRVGASILTRIGLQDLIAENRQEYVKKAITLAEDHDRLAVLRAGMRDRVLASPFCDVKAFTENVEDAYSRMWKRYVE